MNQEDFARWVAGEFPWAADDEDVPFDAREVYEDALFCDLDPRVARHPDIGWIVVADDEDSGARTVIWHEAPDIAFSRAVMVMEPPF